MRIAILHYHLKPGGVTRVIENTVRELNKNGVESLVFCSEQPDTKAYPFDNVRIVPELAYNTTFSSIRAERLKQNLEDACKREWGAPADLWHVHNHSLAKNLELPVVVSHWAKEGQKLLLQIHDFAEDGRPGNYKALLVTLASRDLQRLNQILYPVGDHVAYAFINGRDQSFFHKAGVSINRCHLLANPVWLETGKSDKLKTPEFEDKKLYLYPTRSIRRKNMGELVLWAAAASDQETFGSTMAPTNPTAIPIYNRWGAVAEKLKLPISFGLGERFKFDDLLNTAHSLVTTSVAEGFGLAYLESYLIGRQLTGRDLPDITRDFSCLGIQLQNLYSRLDVPIAWVGRDRLRKTTHNALVRYYQSYRQVFQKHMTELALDDMTQGDLVDFGRLDEPMQESVIELVSKNPALKLDFAPEKLDCFLSERSLASNGQIIKKHFNPEAYGRKLLTIYNFLLQADFTGTSFLDTQQILFAFLDPVRFHLLRT